MGREEKNVSEEEKGGEVEKSDMQRRERNSDEKRKRKDRARGRQRETEREGMRE